MPKAMTERLVDAVEEDLAAFRQRVRESLAQEPPFPLVPVPDSVFLAWFDQMEQGSPPVPCVFPDGRVVVASPWRLALAFVPEGRALLARVERLRAGEVP